MSVGVICCRVLEKEIKAVIRGVPEVSHLEVMEWGLHIQPDPAARKGSPTHPIARRTCRRPVMLGYGRCQALEQTAFGL